MLFEIFPADNPPVPVFGVGTHGSPEVINAISFTVPVNTVRYAARDLQAFHARQISLCVCPVKSQAQHNEGYNTTFKDFIQRWQKSYPPLKRYQHERYRFYFTYFKYEREIRGMIYTTNWIERLNRDYKRVINMRGAMPNPRAVMLLMGTVAQNADIYKYPIYNFLESSLFY